MRALLVQGSSPPTYWGYHHSLPYLRKDATLPPLGLATLAAHLPASWELELHDLHLGPLADEVLRRADAVLVSGMLVQADSMREVLHRARALGKPSVVGGPAPSTSPDLFPEATHVFVGEAEGRLDLLVRALERPGEVKERVLSPSGDAKPVLSLARVPRFELCQLDRYASYAIQVSRGCPFNCEFCDIIEIFGRTPRVKSAAQVLAELDALVRLGARGPLFLVDDNFIGNRKAVAKLLPDVAAWQRAHGSPFNLYTEASLDLATLPDLVKAMVDAGFSALFTGIETPDPAALKEAHKNQNLRMDPGEAVRRLTAAGFEVFAGFIVGFDADDETTFERQRAFIQSLPIPRAMVGTLTALPGTQLWRRLEKEGRLRAASTGDQFDRTNFEPRMGDEPLLVGYRRLLAELYTPEAYFERCALHLEQAPIQSGALPAGWLAALVRILWGVGVVSPRRRHFWRLLAKAARRGPSALSRAVTLALLGEHMVRYTAEDVLPRLDRCIAELHASRAEAPTAPTAGSAEAAEAPERGPAPAGVAAAARASASDLAGAGRAAASPVR